MLHDDVSHRLARLEQLIETIGLRPASGAEPSNSSSSAVALERVQLLTARLRQITAEVATRGPSPDWDAADTIVSRLLLADLTDALQACRVITTSARAALTSAHSAWRNGRRVVDRETRRRNGRATT